MHTYTVAVIETVDELLQVFREHYTAARHETLLDVSKVNLYLTFEQGCLYLSGKESRLYELGERLMQMDPEKLQAQLFARLKIPVHFT